VKGKLILPYYPAGEDNITVAYQDEFAPLTSTTGAYDKIELGGFLAGALTKISKILINNSDFDVVGLTVDNMADAVRRFIENELINGTEGKVTGLSTLTNVITTAAAGAVTADEVVRLRDAIKDRFQQDAVWIMSSKTRTALRLLKGEDGHYLLNDDISAPFGNTLLGKPVFVSDSMPDIEDGGRVIYYGDLKGLATKFGEDISIDVLRERYADEHAVGVISWFEFDGKVANEQALAELEMAE
jgi:HK97 family phage major capsid protein